MSSAAKICPERLYKTVFEEKYFNFNFSEDLDTGETISSVAITASPSGTGHITLENVAYSGQTAQVRIKEGVAGTLYTVTCKATISTGEKVEASGLLYVTAT